MHAKRKDEPQMNPNCDGVTNHQLESGEQSELLNPCSGPDAEALASVLGRLTKDYQELTVDSVCLLVQEHEGTNWFIYREFFRGEKSERVK
jgi:hypothetical protein